jgi:hypothetical protein
MEKYNNEDRYKHASKYNNEAACVSNDGLWVNFYNYLEIKEDTTEDECNELDNTMWQIPYRSDEIDQLTGVVQHFRKWFVLSRPENRFQW